MAKPQDPNARIRQKPTPVRLDGATTRRLDAYCNQGKVPLPKSRVVELAVRQFLDTEDAEQAAKSAR